MTKLRVIAPKKLIKEYDAGERAFRRTKLRGSLQPYTVLMNIDTSGSDWRGVRMHFTYLDNSVNVGTNFSGIDAYGSSFEYSDNRDAILDRSRLESVYFFGADNRGVSLRYVTGLEKYPPKTSWKKSLVDGMIVEGVSWRAVERIISEADYVNLDKMPRTLRRTIYRIVFSYIDSSKREEVIRNAIKTKEFPVVRKIKPFVRIAKQLWEKHREFVYPSKSITKDYIYKVQLRLLSYTGMKNGST